MKFNRLPVLVCIIFGLFSSSLHAQTCTPLGWNKFLDPGPQKFEIIGTTPVGEDRHVTTILFQDLNGPYAKLVLFMEFVGDCPKRAISLGSYADTNAMVSKDGNRIYHLDLYDQDNHSSLGFFEERPNLNEIRDRAISIFAQPAE